MLSTIHLLLTYKCPLRCDHCYVFGSPKNEGHFTYTQVNHLLNQAKQVSSIEWIIFEGGEPFLFYPLLLKSVQKANKLGFKVGVFTNGFFARTEAAAARYLLPLAKQKLNAIVISNDRYHYNTLGDTPALRAGRTALSLGIPVNWKNIHIQAEQTLSLSEDTTSTAGENVPLMMVGRAVENLASRFPEVDPNTLTNCPNKCINNPDRLSIDATGNVQLCPGLAIGNVWKSSLSEIINQYDPSKHPICGPLISGGPLQLSKSHSFQPAGQFIDSCHLCYATRKFLVSRYPEYLAPNLVYGIY
jgi:Radical SAM superfamily/4Fe-4S single cluster domain